MRRHLLALLAMLAGLASPAPVIADQSGGCMPTTGTYTGLQAANYINAGFTSIFTSSSGASPPSNPCGGNPVKGQFWLNTSSPTLQTLSVYNGSQWMTIGTLDLSGNSWVLPPFPSQLKAADGTLGAPGISFTNEPNSGLRRAASSDIRLTIAGVDMITVTPSGVAVTGLTGMPQGQVRLVKSGANLVLQPFDGDQLTIASVNRKIPSAGVSLAPTSLAANTTHYIYAFMSGTAVALEASTTGYSVDTSNGTKIKTGDASRALVGLARTIAGPAWQDAASQRFVASWFNRRPRSVSVAATGSAGVSQTSASPFPSGWVAEYVSWSGDAITHTITANWDPPDPNFSLFTTPWVDGGTGTGTYGQHQIFCNPCLGNFFTVDSLTFTWEPSEGYHSVTLASWVNGGSAVFINTGVNSALVQQ